MRELRSTCAALLTACGLLLGAASSAKAELFTSETAWNTATGMSFDVVGYTAGTDYQFFAACPISNGNCVPLSPDTGPIKSPGQTDQSYIEQYSGFGTLTNYTGVDQAGGKSGTLDPSGSYSFWALKADGYIIALLFNTAVSSLEFAGLSHALSHWAYANPGAVPLPGALLLMGSVLLGSAGFARWRKNRTLSAAV